MAAATPITELDFLSVKTQLKEYLKTQPQFLDYDFEGSNMNVLLDLLAYNTFMNNFYVNMAFSEQFLDSAQLRTSVNSRAKELNYLPASYSSAVATVDITFVTANTPASITIPKNTKFTGRENGSVFTFQTREAYTIFPDEDTNYIASNVEIFEGRLVKENFVVKANNELFTISNKNVDTNTIEIVVRDGISITSANNEYTRRDTLNGVGASDKVFYIYPANDEKYQIGFGRGSFGLQPSIGNVVEISYLISSGEAPNGTSAFSPTGQVSGYDITVTTSANAEGGSTQESVESIKFFAPKAAQIQDRAITESDYKILLKNRFSEIEAVSVFGGEQLDPPQYGRVVVAVDVKNSDGTSDNAKARYAAYLFDRSPLTIEPIVIDPEFLYVDVQSTVYFDTTVTTKGEGEINSIVANTIQLFSNTFLSDFNKTLRYSKLVTAIDDSDESILSNDTELRAIIEYVPVLNSNNNISLEFRNELENNNNLTTASNTANFRTTISSSSFTYQGTISFMQDDGNGRLQVVSSTSSGTSFLNRNAGTVDYTTGKVTLVDFNVSDYDGSGIKFYARLENSDIVSPKNRIIRIRPEDVLLIIAPSRS